jgi:tetratricopeptide (TPR) repeat protein
MPQTTPILFLAFANDEEKSLRQLEPTVEDLEALRESMIDKMKQDAYINPVTDNFPWVTYAKAVENYLDDEEHERVPVLQNNLATVLQALGDYAGARRLFGKAFAVFSHYLGEDHPNTKTVGRWLKHMDELEGKN